MIYEAYYFSPWGLINVQAKNQKIVKISFLVGQPLYSQWTEVISNCMQQLDEYVQGKRKTFTIDFLLRVSGFSAKVLQAVQTIPYGVVKTYQDVADLINHPKAQRAVGSALRKNPLVIVIPCHRIINKNSNKVSYNYGSDIKEALLCNEQKFS